MSQLRAKVRQVDPTLYCATVTYEGFETWSTYRFSWAEAMQAAYVMLRDLDRQLTDRVHAERAERRARAADVAEPVTAMREASLSKAERAAMRRERHRQWREERMNRIEDVYTMEATA